MKVDNTNPEVSEKTIIDFLLIDFKIQIGDNNIPEAYNSLISAGYANYQDGFVSKNWKTQYWREPIIPVPEPITSRFEILDIRQ